VGWDRLERSGSVGGLARSLGRGCLAQLAGTCPTRFAHAAGLAFWVAVSVSVLRRRDHPVVRTRVAAKLRMPQRLKTSPADRPALANGLDEFSLTFEAPCAAARKLVPCYAARLPGTPAPCRQGPPAAMPWTTGAKQAAVWSRFSGSWTRSLEEALGACQTGASRA